MDAIRHQFATQGRADALRHNPTIEMTDARLWQQARHVVQTRLKHQNGSEQDWLLAKAAARGAYVEGWQAAERQMRTVPHLRVCSQVWMVGYRSPADCTLIEQLFHKEDEQATCRLLVDIRFRPSAPFRPDWSRKQLQTRYQHQYRYLHALGNIHYVSPEQPIALVDEAAGLACLQRWLEAGWDIVLLCACADASTCHRLSVAERLHRLNENNPRERFHWPEQRENVL